MPQIMKRSWKNYFSLSVLKRHFISHLFSSRKWIWCESARRKPRKKIIYYSPAFPTLAGSSSLSPQPAIGRWKEEGSWKDAFAGEKLSDAFNEIPSSSSSLWNSDESHCWNFFRFTFLSLLLLIIISLEKALRKSSLHPNPRPRSVFNI